MSYDKTLYIIDSKGKQREWSITTDGDSYTRTFGITGGKMQTQTTKCKAKNIGKSNETTPKEQAKLEAQAKWDFQLNRDDYHWDVKLAGRQIRPMLSLDYLKVPHRVNWKQARAQRKLDGVRLTYGRRYRDEAGHESMTRKGELYKVPHLIDPTIELLEIVNSFCDYRCLALDGEAYIHGMSLQNILSLVKKYKPGKTEEVQYWLFDLVIEGVPFEERHEILTRAYDFYMDAHPNSKVFELVLTHHIFNDEDMKKVHGAYTQEGFEGLMIRHADSMYKVAGRSPDLFKYKHFMDDECLITAMWEDSNGNAMLTVKQKNGNPCDVTPKRTHAYRKEMLTRPDDFIGKWITCKFQTYTDEDIMQFPVGKELRECDDNGEPII